MRNSYLDYPMKLIYCASFFYWDTLSFNERNRNAHSLLASNCEIGTNGEFLENMEPA